MPKPNYQYEKRQRDIAKKKKQDEKRLRKQEKGRTADTDTESAKPSDAPAGDVVRQPDRQGGGEPDAKVAEQGS